MRGTAATLVCLVSLHYFTIIDAYTARFTSENGMPGREHEDKHAQRSAAVRQSLPKTMRQEPDYNWENYGGIPNIPGYMYRDYSAYWDLDTDWEVNSNPAYQSARKSAGAKRSSPDQAVRQYQNYYDDLEPYGGIPNIPGYMYRDESIDSDTAADADNNSFSKTLKRLLSPVVDAVRQLWGKLSGKPLESAGVGDAQAGESAGENARRGPVRKGAMDVRNGEDREAESPKKRNIGDALNYLVKMAKQALDFAYNVIDKIDVSQLTEETKKLKQAVLDALKKAKEAIEQLLGEVSHKVQSPSARRTRSVGKRTNARDALESYLTSLKSLKRSKARNSLRRSMKGNPSARAADMTALMDLMTEMEECIQNIPATNTSLLGMKCIVLPLVKVLTSPKPGGGDGLAMDSDAIESPDNLRRLNFPWGSIFLIPIYKEQGPGDEAMVAHYPHQEPENVTTTTTEPPTTTTTTSTTETPPFIIYDEADKAVRSGSRYRSKYDSGF